MSEAIAFDTHRYVKRLMESGFNERQAETLAEEQIAFLNANLATKSDIARIEAGMEALRQETKAEIDALRQETQGGMEALRQETKAEIDALRQETQGGMEALRQETKAEIDALRQETQGGMEALRQETKSGIEALRLETMAKIEEAKGTLIKWVLGAMVAQTTIILAVVSMLMSPPA